MIAKKQKDKIIDRIKVIYILVLALGATIIAPTHIFPQPYFMYARFPHYLEKMGPFLGITWPESFELYHRILYLLSITISLNGIGILSFPRLKKVTVFSSLAGILIFLLMILFFFFKFINVNAADAVVLGVYSIILLTMEVLIFKSVRQKEAKRVKS
jgi:prepilin signal peptidase PulO-like enzyme (type II secretory pathway)